MRTILLSLVPSLVLFTACTTAPLVPPDAPQMPRRLEIHGDVRMDEYYGMRERENPQVIAYLEAENEYCAATMRHTEGLQEELFAELKGRLQPDDTSVPYLKDGYYRYSRYEEGKEYRIHCRRRGSLDAPEEILLDENVLRGEHEGYFGVGRINPSPGGGLLAYAYDVVGRRFYTIRFRDLTTGEDLPDVLRDVTGNLAWANDGRTVFYTKQDPQTLRSHRIYRHVLGTDPAMDVLVYEEQDETFDCYVMRSRSGRFLFITSSQTLTTEVRFLDANQPRGSFRVIMPRERGHEYRVDHYEDHFYLRTNDQAPNFKLVRAPVGPVKRTGWEEIVPHRPDAYFDGFQVFRDHLVISERRDGLRHLRIRPWNGDPEHELDFGEAAYRVGPRDNHEMNTWILRYSYSSMTTPNSVFDYNMVTREKTLLKQDEVRGGFDPADYTTERLPATAADGVQVPISIVYRNDLHRPGGNPVLLRAYGSYGASSEASFSAARLSLLERGFVVGIAHVRGGQELGRRWYEDGKLLKKINTFTDFIVCAEELIEQGFADPERIFAEGGSAGGLLMGAIANMRPDLFHGIIAAVPFVDVVTTMLDDSIPLTTSEFDEWGDPRDPVYYRYMLSYSPYDQVTAQDYPNLLVTTGLHDSQVQYWEPAKWVARLRDRKTDDNRLLLKTNMEAGHGGATGRYRRLRDTAFKFAFLIDLAR